MANLTHADILKKATYELKQQLQTEEILDYLLSEGVFTQSEFDRCRNQKGRQNQCGELLDILKCKGEDGYRKFCIILERTHGHLKTMLDDIAKGDGLSEYVYVREIDVLQREAEKNDVMSMKEEELKKKADEVQTQKKTYDFQLEELKDNHSQQVTDLKKEHAESMERTERERNKLQTELKQERDRKLAFEEKFEEEKRVTFNLREEKTLLDETLASLTEKHEAYTSFRIQGQEPLSSLDSAGYSSMHPGHCILETSAKCDTKQLLLLPCFHSVCKPCVDQHQRKSVLCKCGSEVNLEEESLTIDYVHRNKARLSVENMECDYFEEACPNKVVMYCTNCNTSLCDSCLQSHNKVKSNKGHKITPPEKMAQAPPWKDHRFSTCTDHADQPLVFVDENCEKLICNVCSNGRHRGHDVIAVEIVYAKRKGDIQGSLVNLESHIAAFQQRLMERRDRLGWLQRKRCQLEDDIRETHAKIAMKFVHRLKLLLQSSEEKEEQLEEATKMDIQFLRKGEEALKTTMTYTQQSLHFTSQAEFVKLADVMERRITIVLDQTLPEDKTEGVHIVFSPQGLRAQEELVEMFGDVKRTDTTEPEEDTIPTIIDTQHKLKTAEENVQELKSNIASLIREKDEILTQGQMREQALNKDLNAVKSKTEQHEETIFELSENVKSKTIQIQEKDTTLVNSEETIKDLQASIATSAAEMDNMKTNSQTRKKDMEKKLKASNSKITEQETTISDHKKENKLKDGEIKDTRKKCLAAETGKKRLEKSIANLTREKDDREKFMERELKASNLKITEQETTISDLRKEIKVKASEIKDLSIYQYVNSLDAETEKKRLKESITNLTSEKYDHLSASQSKMMALTTQNEKAEKDAHDAHEQCEVLLNDKKTLEQDVSTLKKKIYSLKTDMQGCNNTVKTLQLQMEKLGLSTGTTYHLLKTSVIDMSLILQCTHLKYDREKVNINKVHINTDGDLVNKPGHKPHDDSEDRLVKYRGTSSTSPLPQCGSPQYWEVRGRVGIDQTLTGNNLLLQTGLCREEERDQSHSIRRRPQSYSLNVVHCPIHSSICRTVCRHGKYVLCLSDTLPNTAGQSTTLHYGVVYDDARCRVAFIDITDNTVISTLKDVDCSRPLWPMFGVYNPIGASVSMLLVVGNDIDMSDVKRDLILKSLS